MSAPDFFAALLQRLTQPYPWSRANYLFPLNATPAPAATAPALAPNQILPQRTTLTKAQAKAVLKTAMTAVLGRAPTDTELKMLVAQSDLETRTWQAMWHWNFGNSIVGTSGAQWFFIPSDTTHKYRAFASAKVGARYWVNLMQNRFDQAWALLDSDDPYAFASALKDQSYYEAPVETYASGLAARYAVA